MTTDTQASAAQRAVTGAGPWGTALALFACGVGLFQVGLAAGAPWGAAAWGGTNPGVLPAGLRVASGVSALVWFGVAAVAAGRLLGPVGRRRLLLGVAAYSTLGIAMNAASPSGVERAVWVPATLVGAGLAWMAWRESRVR
jgi:hypothetical protein